MENTKTAPPAEAKLHFLDYWRIIRIRKTVILAVFLLVVLTTTAVTYILPKSFLSTVRIAVEKDSSDISGLFDRQTAPGYDPYWIQTQFEIIQSKSVLHKVIDDLKLNKAWAVKYKQGGDLKTPEAFTVLRRMIDVRQFRNTSIIEIRVYDEDKIEAREIANAISEVYRNVRLSQSMEATTNSIEEFKRQWEDQNARVLEAQRKVEGIRLTNHITDINPDNPQATTLDIERIRRMEMMRSEAFVQYVEKNTLLEGLRKLNQTNRAELRKAAPIAYNDPQLTERLQELASTEQKLTFAQRDLAGENPELMKLISLNTTISNQVENLLDGLLNGLATQVAAAEARWKELEKQGKELQEQDLNQQQKYQEFFVAKRELDTQLQLRTALWLKISQEKINVNLPKSSIVRVIDKAEEGLRPVRPNIPLNITLGVIVGLVVGIGLAFFIEYLDTSVKTIDDIERALQAPVLGVIPQNVGSLLEEGPESPHAEAYRVLRTNILFSRKDEKLNCITVVSGGAGEGKSTTLFNLACVFAQAGQRVLIVDSDLRRPSIHKYLKVSNSTGLTNYLLKQNKLEEVIQTTPLPTLDFMPSGKLPNSSMGILNSVQMKQMIQELKHRYEFVFFDSPPIMGVSDASVLASEVDLSLQVIQYRKYPQAMTLRAKQMVDKVGGHLLGVVLNNINISQDSYYYYYSGYYYDYYSKHDEDPETKKNGESKPAAAGDRAGLEIKTKF
jgi:polysaccharide biosynthesis transport protein